jgi:hypothetical protein
MSRYDARTYKPKECINSNCRKIMYIPTYKMHMLLQCEDCQEKRKEKYNAKT